MAEKLHLSKYLNDNGIDVISDNHPLPSVLVSSAKASLLLDADSFFVNALLTFGSAINSLQKNNYSWAFVQCYYVLFYCARFYLAKDGIGVFYSGSRTPFTIKVAHGELFHKVSGNSHQVYLNAYKNRFAGDSFYCGEIDGKCVIDWFEDMRNLINYRKNPLEDPLPTSPLYQYHDDLRKWLATYASDEMTYSFNEAHAYMAFTYNLLNRELEDSVENGRKNRFVTEDVLTHIKDNYKDKKGNFSDIILKISDLIQ